jgi:Leucine-rich repeat (LRR) protein
MAATPRLQHLSAADLDGLIAELRRQGTRELVLLGPVVRLSDSVDQWPQKLRDKPRVYQLMEPVEALAERLGQLTQLTSLNLAHNQIGAAGAASLAALTQLTCLNLWNNQIGDAGAASLAALTQLTCLNLEYNHIGDAGAASLAALTQLTSLNLEYNHIGDAGAASLAALTQLTSLNLEYNHIGDAGAATLAALTQLNSLNLAHNQIGAAGAASLAALNQLTSLNLGNNKIGDLGAAALAALTQLTSLHLEYNQIDDARPISSLPNLEILHIVTGNPLIRQPPEIVIKGDIAMFDYLREIRLQGIDYLYEAKVLILGEGGAGKTSLLRRLYLKNLNLPQEEESTKGIDIHRHEFVNREGRPFWLNVWDFGGQQIYHATHQFFLTKRSLYILVDDTRNNNKTVHDEGFKYWLEVIEALSERSPVLIFQNEKAGRSKDIDEAGIKGRFPNVINVYCGNLLGQDDAATNLEEAIRLHVQQLPHVGDAVPAQWVAIRSELEGMKEGQPYISQKDYLQLYGRYLGIDLSKALRLSQYFHDLGVFLHFQDDPLLQRYVILQNDWATEAVFKVLDDEPTKARKGLFTRSDCQRIWAHSIYEEMHPELLALMEKFELCYKLPDQLPDTWLSPQLLSPSAPELFKDWAKPDDLVLFYEYDFLPKGMISRLMVRKNHLVRQPNLCWVGGAYFEHGDSELLVSLMEKGQGVELRARGPQQKELISVIASDLDALNASFEGLRDKVRKLVPCICSICGSSIKPGRFEQSKLLKRKQYNQLTVQCDESFEHISVLQLLDGLKHDQLPQWAKPLENRQTGKDARGLATEQGSGSSPHRMIKIFLASSSDLKEDRDAFDLHFRQANDRLFKKGIYLKILRWETFLDAISETRLQDEYNKEVRNCDIFVSLFKTKTGQYTEEEFDVAHRAFKDSGKPLIYAYFMETKIPNYKRLRENLMSLWSFQDKLSGLGHYPTHYTSIEDLLLQFLGQLDKLIEEGKI